MTVEYLKIARTDLKAVCQIPTGGLEHPQELPMTLHVSDTNEVEVLRAIITMHISEKR